jgi:hypothetical protein
LQTELPFTVETLAGMPILGISLRTGMEAADSPPLTLNVSVEHYLIDSGDGTRFFGVGINSFGILGQTVLR